MGTNDAQTYHLTPIDVWNQQRDGTSYVPEAFETEGFIHTTIGLDPLLAIANMFYRDDRRPYVALILDLPAVTAAVRHDDPSGLYPHIYGSLNLGAVVGHMSARRGPNGAFLSFEPAD
jgi:uncharacterized protein (DUF952 family)